MKRNQSVALIERGNYSALEPVDLTMTPEPVDCHRADESDIPVVELDGGSLPLGLALVILAALDKDSSAMANMQVSPADVRAALVNAARRVLDEPFPNTITVNASRVG